MNKSFENKHPEFEDYQLDEDSFSDDTEQEQKNWEPHEKPCDQPWYKLFLDKTVKVVSSPQVQTTAKVLALSVFVHLAEKELLKENSSFFQKKYCK